MFTSCEETEAPIYDGSQTLVYFNGTASDLTVEVDTSDSVDIEIGASTISSEDRIVTISVDEENTTVASEIYSFPSTVTIPANEYFGTLTVTAVDNGLTTETQTLTLKIDGIEGGAGGVPSPLTHEVSIVEVCPVPSDYMVGMYQIADITATVGPANGTENFASGTVELTAATATSREFEVAILPAFRGPVTVTVNLVCNTLILAEVGPDPGISCNGADLYVFGTAGANDSAYDVASDQNFTIFYTEDVNGACGGPYLSSFSLTKL